jgi:uncharacterized coiled-coil DUF342 family protein
MKTKFKISRLIIAGIRKNYITTFHEGVNIIYGDSDTGKSTILELINYTLGSKTIELADEINTSCHYVSSEFVINDKLYTFKRDVFNKNNPIEVYPCSFEDCSNFYPDKFNPTSIPLNNGLEYVSDFLLDLLNFPKLKIKTSPSKANSNFQKVSFRNIFKYCYLDQDTVGSKNLLENNNWVKSSILKETFKYITNTLDSSISEISIEIANLINNKDILLKEHSVISKFFQESNIKNINEIDYEINAIDENIDVLTDEVNNLNISMKANSKNYLELKSYYDELNVNTKRLDIETKELSVKIENYSRLLNDYDNDIDKISSVLLAQTRIGEISTEVSPCPICDSSITIEIDKDNFSIVPSTHLEKEVSSLKSRKRDIKSLIQLSKDEHKSKYSEMIENQNLLIKVRTMIDEENSNMVTPFLTQRDALLKELNRSEERRNNLVSTLKLRNQLNKIIERIAQHESQLNYLNDTLDELKSKAPDINVIFSEMKNYMYSYLENINIKNRKNISISTKTFLPVFRGHDYSAITSGGLRTILSIGYYLSLMNLSIKMNINYPNFIMIDTVGKYLGKTGTYEIAQSIDNEVDEGLTDPEKYKNIYAEILNITELAKSKDISCQIIIVDNDIPEHIKKCEDDFVVEHFSTIGVVKSKIGLIDDL